MRSQLRRNPKQDNRENISDIDREELYAKRNDKNKPKTKAKTTNNTKKKTKAKTESESNNDV